MCSSDLLINRIIPQVFNEEMYTYLEDNFEYEEYVFVLYRTDMSNEEVIDMLNKYEKINYLSISNARDKRVSLIISVKLKRIDVEIYVHTINSEIKVFLYKSIGVDGIYSDIFYQE